MFCSFPKRDIKSRLFPSLPDVAKQYPYVLNMQNGCLAQLPLTSDHGAVYLGSYFRVSYTFSGNLSNHLSQNLEL